MFRQKKILRTKNLRQKKLFALKKVFAKKDFDRKNFVAKKIVSGNKDLKKRMLPKTYFLQKKIDEIFFRNKIFDKKRYPQKTIFGPKNFCQK